MPKHGAVTDMMKRFGLVTAFLAMAFAGYAVAQDSEDTVEAPVVPESPTPWTVFVDEDPLQCWVVSAPVETVNTRDGEPVTVNRGDILAFISFWPEQNRLGEVSFTGGYPFAEDSVRIEIGEASFTMFREGETAWALSAEEDRQIIEAMRAGSEAVFFGQSTRGTDTRDTFSLDGFSAAIADAETRCSS
jgi:invasion protein IalB